MAGMSPTKLTLRRLRDEGWPLVEVVETWNPHARVRNDLFGTIDVLAVGPSGVLAVQATSASNASTRSRKLAASDALPILLDAGWSVVVWGWAKVGARWQLTYAKPAMPAQAALL